MSNLDKTLYPGAGILKAQMIQYYLQVSERMISFIRERPLSQVRWPDGIEKKPFYQKNRPSWTPEWIQSVKLGSEKKIDYMMVNDAAALIWMANLACLEIHHTNTQMPEPLLPNYFVYDLDPPADNDFEEVKRSAFLIADFLRGKGYHPFVKTSGGKGLHVLCPIVANESIDVLMDHLKLMAKEFVKSHPDHTLRVSKTVRKDKTLLDIYRNHSSQTIVAPYSLRGKPGAPVSTPLTWEELEELQDPKSLNINSVIERIQKLDDPWKDFREMAVPLLQPEAAGSTAPVVSEESIAALETYEKKRDFGKTPEPDVAPGRSSTGKAFVVHRHHATNLHYDLRLEEDGVLRSWAIPKGMPSRAGVKRLAIETEPHPFKYLDFEGVIPKDEYGGGTMWVFARGEYEVLEKSPKKIKFKLDSPQMKGTYTIFKTKNQHWLIERKDGKDFGVMDLEFKPMLADVAKTFKDAENLTYEIKWDGIRTLIHIDNDKVRVMSRSGRDISMHFPELVNGFEHLRLQTAILDGEIVCLDEKGLPVFSKVISRMHSKGEQKIKTLSKSNPAFCYLFDVLYLDGRNVCREPLWRRQEWVKDLIKRGGYYRMSDPLTDGRTLLKQVKLLGLEGIMIKDKHSPYVVDQRTPHWRKLKIRTTEEVYMIGYTEGKGDRSGGIGSIHTALKKENGEFMYRGKVGTGFDAAKLAKLKRLIDEQEIAKRHPEAENTPENRASLWVEPVLRCEVQYASLTAAGTFREPVFKRILK